MTVVAAKAERCGYVVSDVNPEYGDFILEI